MQYSVYLDSVNPSSVLFLLSCNYVNNTDLDC